MTAHFFVAGIPVGKGSFRSFPTAGSGRMTNANPATKSWQQEVYWEAYLKAGKLAAQYRGPVEVSLVFWLPALKKIPTERLGWPAVKPDIDKLVRTILDALTGIFYVDDGQVCKVIVTKRYGTPVGVTIGVTQLDSIDAHFLQEVNST